MKTNSFRILRKQQIAELTGYSAVHLCRMEREGRFPRRVNLGDRAVGWVEAEVLDWIAERIAERDGQAA